MITSSQLAPVGPFRDLVSVVTLSLLLGTTIRLPLLINPMTFLVKLRIHSLLPLPV